MSCRDPCARTAWASLEQGEEAKPAVPSEPIPSREIQPQLPPCELAPPPPDPGCPAGKAQYQCPMPGRVPEEPLACPHSSVGAGTPPPWHPGCPAVVKKLLRNQGLAAFCEVGLPK